MIALYKLRSYPSRESSRPCDIFFHPKLKKVQKVGFWSLQARLPKQNPRRLGLGFPGFGFLTLCQQLQLPLEGPVENGGEKRIEFDFRLRLETLEGVDLGL